MAEPIEFDVPDAGAPRLDGGDQAAGGPDVVAEASALVVAPPGWTPAEASGVVGGLVANLTLAMYAMRWQQAPAPELWVHIAGDPKQEFPLMGAGLAPVLDAIAPKGSAAAAGVSLSAGLGEVLQAMARRWQVVNTAPPRPQGGPGAGEQPAPAPSPQSGDAGGFRYAGPQLEVLRRADAGSLSGFGIEG